MKKRVRNKKAEGPIGMSFSMIFSILLIIFFLTIGFIAIKFFLRLQNCVQIGNFVNEFQTKVTEVWDSQKMDYELKKTLPSGIEYVCFADFTDLLRGENKDILNEIEIFHGGIDSNMFFYPKEKACDMPFHKINHLDAERMTKTKNPYCVVVNNGKINIKIEKDYIDELPIATCVVGDCEIPWISDAERVSKNNPINNLKNKTITENYSVDSKAETEKEKNFSFNPIDICNLINNTDDVRICTKAVEEQPKNIYTSTDNNRCNSIENVNAKQTCYFATKTQYENLNNIGTQRDISLCEEFNNDPVSKDLCIRHINAQPD